VFISGFAEIFPMLAYSYIFPIPAGDKYFHFFTPKIFFRNHKPFAIFYIYLLSVPVLLIIAGIMVRLQKSNIPEQNILLKMNVALSVTAILFFAVYGHMATWNDDKKKILASDYYCYNNNAEKTARAAFVSTVKNRLSYIYYIYILNRLNPYA
jgi:hypothetical protein